MSDLCLIELMQAIAKYQISKISALKLEWDLTDIQVVNRLVMFISKQLELFVHLGVKSIGPYIKYKNYDISKIEKVEPPLLIKK